MVHIKTSGSNLAHFAFFEEHKLFTLVYKSSTLEAFLLDDCFLMSLHIPAAFENLKPHKNTSVMYYWYYSRLGLRSVHVPSWLEEHLQAVNDTHPCT